MGHPAHHLRFAWLKRTPENDLKVSVTPRNEYRFTDIQRVLLYFSCSSDIARVYMVDAFHVGDLLQHCGGRAPT